MALADCVIFNCHGLDRHESPDSNQHIKVIAEKGNDKGQVLGVPCFSFLYNDENTTPDHSGVLIKRVCGNMKNTTVGLTRKSQSILRLKLALTMRQVLLDILSNKATADCVLCAANPVTAHDQDSNAVTPLKSEIVTTHETDEIICILISLHAVTGAYSSKAVAKLGFPFHDTQH
jgi:hypothetical protein